MQQHAGATQGIMLSLQSAPCCRHSMDDMMKRIAHVRLGGTSSAARASSARPRSSAWASALRASSCAAAALSAAADGCRTALCELRTDARPPGLVQRLPHPMLCTAGTHECRVCPKRRICRTKVCPVWSAIQHRVLSMMLSWNGSEAGYPLRDASCQHHASGPYSRHFRFETKLMIPRPLHGRQGKGNTC